MLLKRFSRMYQCSSMKMDFFCSAQITILGFYKIKDMGRPTKDTEVFVRASCGLCRAELQRSVSVTRRKLGKPEQNKVLENCEVLKAMAKSLYLQKANT